MTVINLLNNIFDQYDQLENRITNSFLQAVAKNPILLRAFLRTVIGISISKGSKVIVSSQKEPLGKGDSDTKKEEIGSIPDGWIIIDDETAIVFESKIARGAIRSTQLIGHIKRVNAFNKRILCVITPDDESPIKDLRLAGCSPKWISWRGIYDLVTQSKKSKSELAEFMKSQFKEYLSMAEDLVGFRGINFSSGNFNQSEAKTIIKNLTKEIKPALLKVFPRLRYERKSYTADIHPYTVTPRGVWSYLAAEEEHTKDLHITFWLTETHLGLGITVPHKARERWIQLKSLFKDENLFDEFVEELLSVRKSLPNLYLEFLQRHFLLQRYGINDGNLEFDIDSLAGKNPVKTNPLWLAMIRELVLRKSKYNGQFMIRTKYFYKDHPEMNSERFRETIIYTVKGFKKLFHLLEQ